MNQDKIVKNDRSIVGRHRGSLWVLRESKQTPTDEDWDEFLRELESSRDDPNLKILVVTDGGGPNSGQRKRLARTLDGRNVRVAVVTDSATVRFIVSSVALLNRDIATFMNKDLEEAFSFLKLNVTDRIFAKRTIDELNPMIVDLKIP